jgi:BirA family biotin operon repressor/biotin-[acetyl-CoA-carboxylase] ligase
MTSGDVSHLVEKLSTKFVGRNILYYASISSTIDEAKRAAKAGIAEGTIIVAEEQTAGRGRMGRAWLSPKGNIALSLVLYPSLGQLPCLNMIASLAVANIIEKLTPLKAELKWPNDVLTRGKKVCGILVDSALRGKDVEWAIISLGLNVNLAPIPAEFANFATSLSYETGHDFSLSEVLISLLNELERLYLALQRGEPIYEQWRSKLETLGKTMRVKSGNIVEEGFAESVNNEGHLLLRRHDGSLVELTAGEVTLRP